MTTPTPPCIIGQTHLVHGRITGDEDLIVEGRVEGSIALSQHLVVEPSGVVIADIDVAALTVRGRVRGDIVAREGVSILAGAVVVGDVRTPRIYIEDGARVQGSLDMDVDVPEHATPPAS